MIRPLLAAASILSAAAASAAPPSPGDRLALERLAADNDAAWTAKDWPRIVAQYAADGTLRVGPAANLEAGREAITRFFQSSFASRPDGFRHLTEVRSLHMVTADVAIADAHVRVEKSEGGGGWRLIREFSNNSVLIRDGDAWKIHSVRAYPLPATSGG